MEDASGGQSGAIRNEMKMNLRNVILQAKKGSRQHIIELAEEIASIPEALRSDAFEAFATHIGGPASGGDDDVLVMSGIGYLGHNGFFEGNNACVSTVSKIWKGLFANMRARCDKLRKDPAAARRGQDVVAAMASVLCAFATNERLHQQIFSGNSTVFKLVSQLWYLEDLETSASWTLPYTSASIGMIFRGNDVQKGVDILAQQAGGNIDRVVEGFLVRLRKAIRDYDASSETTLRGLALLVSAIFQLSRLTRHSIAEAFLKQDIMAPVTEATLIVAKSILYLKNRGINHLAVVVDKMFLDVPSEYLLFFQGMTLLPGVWGVGKPVVKSAVRNGLLEILVKVADLSVMCSKRLVIDDIKIILSLLIPPLFVFDSVLVEFAAAFRRIPPKDLQELSSGFTGELDNTWNLFYDRLFEKLVIKHRWDIRNKAHQKDALKTCHTCKKRDDGENFKRCSRCKKIVYCSVECQRTDWMRGHKKDCDLGALCNRYPQKNTVTDQAFLTELVKVDLERHAEDLAALAARKYPGMPYNRVAFEVHYSRSYPMIDVVSLDSVIARARSTVTPNLLHVAKHVLENAESGLRLYLIRFKQDYAIETGELFAMAYENPHPPGPSVNSPKPGAESAGRKPRRGAHELDLNSIKAPPAFKATYDWVDKIMYSLKSPAYAASVDKHPWEHLDEVVFVEADAVYGR